MPLRRSDEEDSLLRQRRQAEDALRWLRERLIGGTDAPEGIRQDAAVATRELLGDQAPLLTRLDALTAARLIGSAEQVTLWAMLVDVEAEAAFAAGDAAGGAARRARAADLREAAASIAPTGQGM
jgi:hypothetical protein